MRMIQYLVICRRKTNSTKSQLSICVFEFYLNVLRNSLENEDIRYKR